MSDNNSSFLSFSLFSRLLPCSLAFVAGAIYTKLDLPLVVKKQQLFLEKKKSIVEDQETEDEEDDDDEDEFVADQIKDSKVPGSRKMLLVVRSDLKMGKGKIVAQCCHATLGAYKRAQRHTPYNLGYWEHLGQAKVCVKVQDETEFLEIQKNAIEKGLLTYVVIDAGRTQIAPNSKTVLAIGPAPIHELDAVAKHLKLL